jgi:hypothetical protein
MKISTVGPNQAEREWPSDQTEPGVESGVEELAHGADLLFLTSSHALEGTEDVETPEEGWAFTYTHLDARGSVRVRPTQTPGVVHVATEMVTGGKRQGFTMEAEVRESWLHVACMDAENDEERARRIVHAIATIAGLPRQQTVKVEPLTF